MKIISFLFLFLLFSCTTAKFHTMDDGNDITKGLKGNVKSLEMTTFLKTHNDTIGMKSIRTFYFDRKMKLMKEQYSDGKDPDETVYIYNSKGLIESTITKDISGSRVSKSEFEYDKKKNCISIKYFGNDDTLRAIKTSKYDHKNNVIEEVNTNLQNEKHSWREAYFYDYKKRNCLLKTFDADSKEKNSILEFHYDKKGNIIEINKINSKTGITTQYTLFEYDQYGNSISQISLDEKKNDRGSSIDKNEYDNKGNIIKSESFYKGKSSVKSIIDITYW
jgi:hypothetical protein